MTTEHEYVAMSLASYHVGVTALAPEPRPVLRQECRERPASMHMEAILRITAILQLNADAELVTDKSRLVEDLHVEFPLIARETLLAIVESSIAAIGGIAI